MGTSDADRMKEEGRREWGQVAGAWQQWNPQFVEMSRAATEAIVREAGVGLGMRVLDLACGTGEPALTLAERVGPEGRVIATDLVPEMLASAEENARRRGLTNVEFELADPESLPFSDQEFDSVTCRLGIMFFPNAGQAMKEVHRVLKPGGRAAFVAQGPGDRNPWQTSIIRVLQDHVEMPRPRGGSVGPFRFAAPGTLSAVLEDAGLREVREDCPDLPWPWPGSPENYWEYRQAMSPLFRPLLERIPARERPRVDAEVLQSIGEYYDGRQINFTAAVVVASGVR